MNMSGIFYSEKVPKKGDKRIACAAENLFYKIMCAPKDATEEEIESAAGPSGTTHGWKIAHDREDKCVECKDDPNRNHWLLVC